MAKKRKKSSKKVAKKSKFLVYTVWILVAVVLVGLSAGIGYYIGVKKDKKLSKTIEKTKVQKESVKTDKKTIKKELKDVLKKETKYISAAHEIDDEKLANPPKNELKDHIKYKAKPKLAIIIDDVQSARQVNAVKSLHLALTMSFLPPRKGRKNSAKLASKEKFYMVHLPMEAMHFNAEEPDTLRVRDSQSKILRRIEFIKKEFPRVHYLNNHTGSKFTSSRVAMKRLIYALKVNHIYFVDSRTTAKTKAPEVLKGYGLKYVARDVFLDHHMEKAYVKKQIRLAVKVAKLRGHAIAIGHPHKETLEAIRESKDLFKDVDLVQVNKIY